MKIEIMETKNIWNLIQFLESIVLFEEFMISNYYCMHFEDNDDKFTNIINYTKTKQKTYRK